MFQYAHAAFGYYSCCPRNELCSHQWWVYDEYTLHIQLPLNCLLSTKKSTRFPLITLHFRLKYGSASKGTYHSVQNVTLFSFCSPVKSLDVNFALTRLICNLRVKMLCTDPYQRFVCLNEPDLLFMNISTVTHLQLTHFRFRIAHTIVNHWYTDCNIS